MVDKQGGAKRGKNEGALRGMPYRILRLKFRPTRRNPLLLKKGLDTLARVQCHNCVEWPIRQAIQYLVVRDRSAFSARPASALTPSSPAEAMSSAPLRSNISLARLISSELSV